MLRPISSDLFQPGQRFPGAVCDSAGRVLIPAGVQLTEGHIAKLGTRVLAGLFAGADWPPENIEANTQSSDADQPGTSGHTHEHNEPTDESADHDRNSISVDSLRAGSLITRSIYDESDVLLLAAGSKITPRFLYLLHRRGIRSVRLRDTPEVPADDTSGAPGLAELNETFSGQRHDRGPERSCHSPNGPRLSLESLSIEVKRGLEKHANTGAVLADVCEDVASKRTVSAAKLHSLIDEFIGMLTIDCDLLTNIVAMRKSLGEYIFDHCVNVSLMSMSIAAQLGFKREQLLELGFGTIFHDAGMRRVPEEIRFAPRALTPAEWAEVRRHPTYALEFLEGIRGPSSAARYIGYQAHERANGTGYPRHLSALAIHPYARVVAVADTYAAMIRPRPHRAAVAPHEAIKQTLVAGSHNQLDRVAVRALLDCVSAFPIGSVVELDVGLVGKVVRANPGAHARPVIVEVNGAGEPSDLSIDLSKELDLEVIRVLPQATSDAEQRTTA